MIRSLFVALALTAGMTGQAAAQEAALAGNWTLKIVSPQGTREPTMQLTQNGSEVTGTYRSKRGEAPITGTVKGREFALTVKLGSGENQLVVEYKGQVDGNSLQGRVHMGRMGEAPFTGARTP